MNISAGLIFYLVDDKTIKYLLVRQNVRTGWAPVKGRNNQNETLIETRIRETGEEVGLFNEVDYRIVPHFSFRYEYHHPKDGNFIINDFCIAEYLHDQNYPINIDNDELDEYKWLSLDEMRRKNRQIWCKIIELIEKVEDNLRHKQKII